MKPFQDHFSGHAATYAQHRPRYPPALFSWLRGLAPSGARAWDAATGNGQAALALAAHFDEVYATDASASQIAAAEPHPRVRYAVEPAESPSLEAGSCDLVTVAQALHWLDVPAFHASARRVLRAGGVIAEWCYALHRIAPEVDLVVARLYTDVVGEYWPPERRLLERGYRDLPFPFPPIEAPAFAMTADWALADLLGYLDTWSSVQRFRAARASDPLDVVRAELATAWGPPERRRPVEWPLALRVGRA